MGAVTMSIEDEGCVGNEVIAALDNAVFQFRMGGVYACVDDGHYGTLGVDDRLLPQLGHVDSL